MSARLDPRAAVALFFGVAFALLAAAVLGAPLNHDEDQFVAGGALLARQGLLPYRDFAYFHTPNLVGVYALLFHGADHLLLAARLFSALCAGLSAVVLFAFAWGRLADRDPRSRLLLALGVAALFLANPISVYTYPRAWNNALPTLLTLLAFVCHCRGARAGRVRWFFLGGALISLAAGTRISFAPLALPFLVLAGFAPPGRRLAAIGACFGGMFVGALPVFALFAAAPAEFFFDNLVYNSRINSLYRLATGDTRSVLVSKGLFALKTLANPGNLALLAASAFLLFRRRSDYARLLLFALLPFALLGVFAPTPSYTQYYYPFVALASLGIAIGLPARSGIVPPLVIGLAVSVGLLASIIQHYDIIRNLAAREWIPLKVHDDGAALRRLAGPGRILTLAPIVALEGGAAIYEPFVTGSFAWRTAPYLPEADRRRYGFVAAEDLPAFLAGQPPAGILLGLDKKRETALLAYARSHGYRAVKLPKKITLWLPPATR